MFDIEEKKAWPVLSLGLEADGEATSGCIGIGAGPDCRVDADESGGFRGVGEVLGVLKRGRERKGDEGGRADLRIVRHTLRRRSEQNRRLRITC